VNSYQMTGARILLISIPWTVLAANSLCAADLSSYRDARFGTSLPEVAKQVGMKPSEAKLVHQRPATIQELNWQTGRFPAPPEAADPVNDIRFSFYNGELYRMVVNYDRHKTEGLTAEDMIEAISVKYGTATRPAEEIALPSISNETVKVLARWEDSQYSFDLVRSSYQISFEMVMYSKPLGALAQAANIEAIRMDQEEAPQREIDRVIKQEEDYRIQQEKARLVNRGTFRP
jgi:hypothetical protein